MSFSDYYTSLNITNFEVIIIIDNTWRKYKINNFYNNILL